MHPLRFCAERPVLIGELNPFSYVLTREQVAFDRAGRKILPARPKTPCSRNLKGEENLPVLCREGDEHRLRGTEESHRREP